MPVKVLNAAGCGSFAAIADGFVYAATMDAKVVNASLGGAGTSATLDNAIRAKPNTLYVIAAGNDGVDNDTSPHTPCVPATYAGRGEQDLRRGDRLERRSSRASPTSATSTSTSRRPA